MNNQQVDQILTFYRINFGFHDPYKFLLDGNFIKLMVEREVDFKKRLENAITGKTKFYVPSCLIRELELLGNDFKLVLQKAKEFRKVSCKHALEVSVDRCIKENMIGESNTEMYIVCTQDIELRRDLRQVLNCPLMYFGPDQRIKFEDVHKKNLILVEQQAKQKLLPKQNQIGQIIEYKKQMALKQKEEQKKEIVKRASELGVKVKVKIARGPNPLSTRRRKLRPHEMTHEVTNEKHNENPSHNEQNSNADQQKTKRIRKRKNKNKDVNGSSNA